ncbi:PASTA domain-containing protein [Polymorphospora sp. NPDC051019]|uniref:PASTA domain-containing protein n=1 Tax=Polymorphospora sp. NPDC051019 TaxID=3155725 RepID=UPI0034354E69
MTDGNGSWGAPGGTRQELTRPGVLAGAAVLTVVLAVVGATAGWAAAGSESDSNANPGGSTPSATTSQQAPDRQDEPTKSPTPSPSASSSAPPESMPMPDVLGMECEEAVEELKEAGLRPPALLIGRGKVDRQSPDAGVQVRQGQPVIITCDNGRPGGPSPSESDGGDEGDD